VEGFMAYLNGEKQNNSAILGFAKKLALALGYEETYF